MELNCKKRTNIANLESVCKKSIFGFSNFDIFLFWLVVILYTVMMQVGVDQDYEPIQPIHYSHRIHAGSNGIDCKYCHSAARVSKNAGIPSLNVCMNCHKNIAEVLIQQQLPSIQKILRWRNSKAICCCRLGSGHIKNIPVKPSR
jgi:hypothetical protein